MKKAIKIAAAFVLAVAMVFTAVPLTNMTVYAADRWDSPNSVEMMDSGLVSVDVGSQPDVDYTIRYMLYEEGKSTFIYDVFSNKSLFSEFSQYMSDGKTYYVECYLFGGTKGLLDSNKVESNHITYHSNGLATPFNVSWKNSKTLVPVCDFQYDENADEAEIILYLEANDGETVFTLHEERVDLSDFQGFNVTPYINHDIVDSDKYYYTVQLFSDNYKPSQLVKSPTGYFNEESGVYALSVASNNDSWGTVSASPSDKFIKIGSDISLSAKPNEGYRLVRFESADADVQMGQFTMPKKDVSVNAVFGHDCSAEYIEAAPATTEKAGAAKPYYECTCGRIFEDADLTQEIPETEKEALIIPQIAAVKIDAASTYVFDGKAKVPAVTVEDSAGNLLANGADYTVSYLNNKNVGKATVTVAMTGNYEGTFTKSFVINPKGTSISKLKKGKKRFTVKWKKQTENMASSKITGYQIRYSKKASMKNAKVKTVKGYSKYSKKIKKLKAHKKYYVQIRTYKTVDGVEYYSAWSAKKSVKTR